MKQWLVAVLALAFVPGIAVAEVETGMLVNGSIVVNPDGSVRRYSIDKADKSPATALQTINGAIPDWRFAPITVDGKPAQARADMTLRLLLEQKGEDRYAAHVAAVRFDDYDGSAGVSIKDRVPPRYPRAAIRARVGADVFVVVEVAPNGEVARAAIEQVNLMITGSERTLKRWRETFADSALDAVRKWTFSPPASAEAAIQRVPIGYSIGRDSHLRWREYTPGPRQSVPWAEPELLAGPADLVVGDGVQELGDPSPLTLLSKPSAQ